MKNRFNYIISAISYTISMLLIVYYLVLEFSIIDVTSPSTRITIILFVVLLMYIGLIFFKRTGNEKYRMLAKTNIKIWLLLYLIMILNLTLFDKYFGRDYVSYDAVNSISVNSLIDKFNSDANLKPFKTIESFYRAYKNGNMGLKYFMINIFGNIVAFMPLAFLLPRSFKYINKWYKFFIITSLFILFIETMQLVMSSGAFDIDDYILNIFGAMFLYELINNKIVGHLLNKVLYLE